MSGPYASVVLRDLPWRAPLEVLSAFADDAFTLGLLSADSGWSYLCRAPERVLSVGRDDPGDPLAAIQHWLPAAAAEPGGPPFQGGAAGLLGYELGARYEPVPARGAPPWPDLACGLYPALLAFDHAQGRVVAVGRGGDASEAARRAATASDWLQVPAQPPATGPLAADFVARTSAADYAAAVAGVTARIRAGELFQANIARLWSARLRRDARPFDLLSRLASDSKAPFAAYFRLPGLAVVSNTPERFLRVDAEGGVQSRPIKGTRPRGSDPAEDARLARALMDSAKDRAENLMIVDLMRNDLARACAPGSVEAVRLFELETYANVHHLTSTVTGRLAPGRSALDLMRGAFPPGSVTGAPKVQAMRVIGDSEPPRGPYCGSLFWAGFDGALDSSVLIRTAACVETADGWSLEARAGAGITADSDPEAEADEVEAKISAIARALLQ